MGKINPPHLNQGGFIDELIEYLDYFIMRKNEHISYLNNEYPSVRIMNVCGKIFVCN